MNKTKNLPTAQGMLLMSLEPFFVSSSYNAVSITRAFHSCLSALSCPATIVLVMQCCCPSPSPSLSLSCGCPCYWSSSPGPHCCGYCCCPVIGVSVVPSHCFCCCGSSSFLLLLCQLLISTPQAGAHSSGMGVCVLSWCCLTVINIDKT